MKGYRILRLLEAKDLRNKANRLRSATRDCYPLFFQSEKTGQIEGKIHDISFDLSGRFSLFVTPVTSEPNLYKAIINRVNA